MKRHVKPEQYLQLLNAELEKVAGFRDGMKFVYRPAGSTAQTAWGTAFVSESLQEGVGREVQAHVDSQVLVVL
jgi:hypothetical protein